MDPSWVYKWIKHGKHTFLRSRSCWFPPGSPTKWGNHQEKQDLASDHVLHAIVCFFRGRNFLATQSQRMCQSTSNQLSFFNVCQPLSLRQIQWREPFESWKTPRDNFLKPHVGQNPTTDGIWWADLWGVVFVPMWFRVSVPPCGWHLTPLNGDTGFPDRVAFGWMMPPRITHHLPSLTQTPLSYNSRHTHPHPSWPSAVRFFEEDVEQTAQITRAKCHLWLVRVAQGINRSCGWKVRICLKLQALVT